LRSIAGGNRRGKLHSHQVWRIPVPIFPNTCAGNADSCTDNHLWSARFGVAAALRSSLTASRASGVAPRPSHCACSPARLCAAAAAVTWRSLTVESPTRAPIRSKDNKRTLSGLSVDDHSLLVRSGTKPVPSGTKPVACGTKRYQAGTKRYWCSTCDGAGGCCASAHGSVSSTVLHGTAGPYHACIGGTPAA
jgi:hypothetical protein